MTNSEKENFGTELALIKQHNSNFNPRKSTHNIT